MCGQKRTWSIAATMMCGWALGTAVAAAQPASSRVEVGGQLHLLRPSESSTSNVGVGGRVTVDVTRWWSVEGEVQFFPDDTYSDTSRLPDGTRLGIDYERRRATILGGVKAGYRGDRFGVFGKLRPGVTSLADRGVDCRGDVCALVLLAVPEYRPEFALDLGGVFEWYPSARWVGRVDVGSLMIRHRSSAPPCPAGGCTSQNVAASAGVGFRF
jgi:hypothetical protein